MSQQVVACIENGNSLMENKEEVLVVGPGKIITDFNECGFHRVDSVVIGRARKR